jgi:hypothetical protein
VWDGRLTPGVAVYFAFMALFLVLGMVGAGLSLGIYLFPLAGAMALGLLIWKRRALLFGSLAVFAAVFWTFMYSSFTGF